MKYIEKNIPSWTSYWLMEAMLKSVPSKDTSTKVGSLCVGKDNELLTSGFNGFARGIHDLEERYINKTIKYDFTIHSEINSIINSSRTGTSLIGSTMYVYGLPVCSNCANGIIQAGITKVVSLGKLSDRWIESNMKAFEKFEEVGIPYTHYLGDNPEELLENINTLNFREKFEELIKGNNA